MEIEKKKIPNTNITKVTFGYERDPETNELMGSIELDIENQVQFIEQINLILDEGESLIILSLSEINYIDSSGLWAIFESFKKAEQRSGKIVLLNPRKDVRRVLDITKISSKIKIFEEDESAINYLSQE
jgi:anti-sigma B factor antagonist